MTIRALFKGQDESMGFKRGEVYCIQTRVASKPFSTDGVLVVQDSHSHKYCPYSRLETFLANWDIIEVKE